MKYIDNKILHLPTQGFNAMLIKLSNNELSEERAKKITPLGCNFFQKLSYNA